MASFGFGQARAQRGGRRLGIGSRLDQLGELSFDPGFGREHSLRPDGRGARLRLFRHLGDRRRALGADSLQLFGEREAVRRRGG